MAIEHDDVFMPLLPELNKTLQAQGYESLLFVTLKITDGKVGICFTRRFDLDEQIEALMLARKSIDKTIQELLNEWNRIKRN